MGSQRRDDRCQSIFYSHTLRERTIININIIISQGAEKLNWRFFLFNQLWNPTLCNVYNFRQNYLISFLQMIFFYIIYFNYKYIYLYCWINYCQWFLLYIELFTSYCRCWKSNRKLYWIFQCIPIIIVQPSPYNYTCKINRLNVWKRILSNDIII